MFSIVLVLIEVSWLWLLRKIICVWLGKVLISFDIIGRLIIDVLFIISILRCSGLLVWWCKCWLFGCAFSNWCKVLVFFGMCFFCLLVSGNCCKVLLRDLVKCAAVLFVGAVRWIWQCLLLVIWINAVSNFVMVVVLLVLGLLEIIEICCVSVIVVVIFC